MIYAPFFRALRVHNPVLGIPLMLPMVLYGSGSFEGALLFGLAMPLVFLISVAGILATEQFIPPHFTLFALMLLTVVLVTSLELLFVAIQFPVTHLGVLLFRATAVSGILVQPTLLGGRREPKTPRFVRIAGAIFGFSLVLFVLTLIRIGLRLAGVQAYGGMAVGFIALAVMRMMVVRSRSGHEETQ